MANRPEATRNLLLVHPRTWVASGWLFGPRVIAYLVWLSLPTPPPAGIVTVFVALDLAVLALQTVFVSGAALRASGPIIHLLLRLMQVMVLFATISVSFDRLANANLAPLSPRPAPAQLPVIDGTAVFSGLIDLASYTALAETIRANPTLQAIRLTSDGGNVAAARGMARLILEAKLATTVTGTCASACTLAFLAGQNRSLAPEARLGFHAYRLETGARVLNTQDEQSRDRDWMIARGVKKAFLDQAFATPFTSMWFPERQILEEAGILSANAN